MIDTEKFLEELSELSRKYGAELYFHCCGEVGFSNITELTSPGKYVEVIIGKVMTDDIKAKQLLLDRTCKNCGDRQCLSKRTYENNICEKWVPWDYEGPFIGPDNYYKEKE